MAYGGEPPLEIEMTHNHSADVETLIRKLMATGKYGSEDDLLFVALDRLNDESNDDDEDLKAVLEAIHELDEGDKGMDLDEAFEEVRLAVEKRLQQ
jgi:Arc/MetJ-type ribon-helix-helix transcriptional regulator